MDQSLGGGGLKAMTKVPAKGPNQPEGRELGATKKGSPEETQYFTKGSSPHTRKSPGNGER